MKRIEIILILLIILIKIVSGQMKINYYRDQYCNNYANSLPISNDAIFRCLKYEYSGAGSFLVANCDEYTGKPGSITCRCSFFVNDNCSGRAFTSTYKGISKCGNTAYTLKEPKSIYCERVNL